MTKKEMEVMTMIDDDDDYADDDNNNNANNNYYINAKKNCHKNDTFARNT